MMRIATRRLSCLSGWQALRRPDAGRDPRQYHAVLADGYGSFGSTAVLGGRTRHYCSHQGSAAARQASGSLHGVPGRDLPAPRATGSRVPITTSSITTRLRVAATSPLGRAGAVQSGDARRVSIPARRQPPI
jgi:hypothetical protein